MEREIKTIKLEQSGKTLRYYAWMNAGEMFDLAEAENSQKFMLETLIVDIDGKTDDIYEQVRSLSLKDYKQLDSCLLELIADIGNDKEKKN